MISYNEKGSGLHEAIRKAGHWLREENGVWISSNDTAVQAIIDGYDPLVNMRADLFATVKAERDRRQQLGMPYAFPDGAVGTIQTRDQQDLVNVSGLVTASLVLEGQGQAPTLNFRDAENVTHLMTPAQLIAMGMAVSQFVTNLYAAKWAHDGAIAVWGGIGKYDLTAYWPV
jgi:hypothetical protein